MSDENRFFEFEIPAERGVFFDRYGDVLVENYKKYYELDDYRYLYSLRQPIKTEDALVKMASNSAYISYSLARRYLYKEALAHLIGYVGTISKEDLLTDKSLSINDSIGKLGLEKEYERQLRGQKGSEVFEINTHGEKIRLLNNTEFQAGQSLETTLDPYLSQVALKAMGKRIGSVIIADAQTGEILTLVNSPSFDPNVMSGTYHNLKQENERKALVENYLSDSRQVFFNRAVNGIYPPGSIFKLVNALGGLEEGSIDPQTLVDDEGILKVGDYEYANWYFTQYGRVEGKIALRRAIARSNDIYFYKAAEWLGPTKLAEYARLFGFGKKTGINLSQESAGLVPDPAWKEKEKGERWYLGNTYHFGIGQGDILVTPIQMSQLVQSIFHEGSLCKPSFLKNESGRCTDLGIKKQNIEEVLTGMLDACSSGGTAFPFFEYNTKHRLDKTLSAFDQIRSGAIACKTGTAEFGAADLRGYRQTHAWFVALAGIDINQLSCQDPIEMQSATNESNELISRCQWLEKVQAKHLPEVLTFTVLVESDDSNPYQEGSKDAAPVVLEILNWINGQKTSQKM